MNAASDTASLLADVRRRIDEIEPADALARQAASVGRVGFINPTWIPG